jgi:hypothetical protein
MSQITNSMNSDQVDNQVAFVAVGGECASSHRSIDVGYSLRFTGFPG